jgi:HD superfamily phosphohydrolase
MNYLSDHKIISDIIHGSISLSKLAMLIIDTPEFQRLRYIKQLSTCHFVYPNAIHTRFEHSVGTYHLCKKMLYALKNKSKHSELDIIKDITELQTYFKENNITSNYLNNFIIELISIGALCHDIGHACFSHLFDDYFLKNNVNKNDKYIHHEYRSCMILEHIINKNIILKSIIDDNLLKFIFNIINPNPEIHNGYIYQIVSNSLNSIDVDKFDYLTRDSKMLGINISFNFNRLIENAMVINNIICYSKKTDTDIVNLFLTRHYLHKKVYSHKSVIASLLLINELLTIMNQYYNFTSYLNDINKFIMLTDDFILTMARYHSIKDENLKNIINKLDSHNLYTLIYNIYLDINDNLSSEIKEYINSNNKIIYFENIIGFISGKKNNPLDNVYLYGTKDPYNELSILSKSDSNKLLPNKYQEKIILIYYIDSHDREQINKIKQKISKNI